MQDKEGTGKQRTKRRRQKIKGILAGKRDLGARTGVLSELVKAGEPGLGDLGDLGHVQPFFFFFVSHQLLAV